MSGLELLPIMGLLMFVPGAAASLLALRPGYCSTAVRAASIFGLGFVVAAGLAFFLAATHLFWLAVYLVLWGVVTVALWFLVWRRQPLRAQARSVLEEITASPHRLAALAGVGVVIAITAFHLPYLHYLGASRYIYYLNGMQIANAHGVPAATLEYGHSWPPATDKVVLDSFSGVLAMIGHNAAPALGVLGVLSVLGVATGWWATAWELGLPRAGALLPLFMLASRDKIPGIGVTVLFWEYRAEDFGLALAFCAVALGLHAFRRRESAPAVAAGLVLAAAAGSHLIPLVAAVIMLFFAGIAEMVRSRMNPDRKRLLRPRLQVATASLGSSATDGGSTGWFGRGRSGVHGTGPGPDELQPSSALGNEHTLETQGESSSIEEPAPGQSNGGPPPDPAERVPAGVVLRQGLVMAGVLGVVFLAIRLAAGGSFGLGGASNPASYSNIRTRYDPTLFLFDSTFHPRVRPPYLWFSAREIVLKMMTIGRHALPLSTVIILFAVAIALAALFMAFAEGELQIAALTGVGLAAAVIVLAIAFDFHYSIWVDATFGVRRLQQYISIGFVIVGLAVVELLVIELGRRRWIEGLLSVALAIGLCTWMLPGTNGWKLSEPLSDARITFFDWVRADTACGARFLVDQRTEGVFSALSGRYALMEGMGSFLRPRTMNYVVHLMLGARRFYTSPLNDEAYLRKHDINYVVTATGPVTLGYPVLRTAPNVSELNAAPFLHEVLAQPYLTVYQVKGAPTPPVSPLLTGPYLHCETTPLHF
jgi:hypothetical protein